MLRNDMQHYAQSPGSVDIHRSKFDWSHRHATTFNAGYLIPIDWQEILPGQTIEFDATKVLCRMATPIVPVMDECWLDYFTFFIPNRLIWQHWEEFCGANKSGFWAPSVTYQVPTLTLGQIAPQLTASDTHRQLFDYFGIPVNVISKGAYDAALAVSVLPFRAYNLVWNEWFRDENLQDPVLVSMADTDNVANYDLLIACKKHDRYTSCLPAPQRGPAVDVPFELGNSPIITGNVHSYSSEGVLFNTTSPDTSTSYYPIGIAGSGPNGTLISGTVPDTLSGSSALAYPVNLWADNSDAVYPLSINSLRLAFQTQRLLEKDARFGSGRYKEILKGHFGVTSSDARLQRPEYITGGSMRLNMQQVAQTSATDSTTPQGNLAAYSVTMGASERAVKSFEEHGILLTVACVRYNHSYSQGIEEKWTRKNRFDFYWPTLAHIGEQPVMQSELYVGAGASDTVFGYQEAWSSYRFLNDRVSGLMRPDAERNLAFYNYSDNYQTAPSLSSTWIAEDPANVSRTLAVESGKQVYQFIADFYFDWKAILPMPVYSVPGLIDHF